MIAAIVPTEVSLAGQDMIMGFEQLRQYADRDEAGVWTIGYGHTPAYERQFISRTDAEELFDQDLRIAETIVSQSVTSCDDDQHAALVSLCFSIGHTAFRSSTVLREHNAGNFAAAWQAFLVWDKIIIDGQLVADPRLLDRRNTEMAMYAHAISSAVDIAA